jgi:predicted flavoprotein YhiN
VFLDRVQPIARAISTAGGVPFGALDAHFMLRERPGVFVAGEMLDWDAPTGGYLLTACLATGRHAGREAARWLDGLRPEDLPKRWGGDTG